MAHRLARAGFEGLGAALARGAAWSLATNIVGAGVSLSAQLLAARALGKEGYGMYVYVLAWLNVALLAAKVDLDGAAERFVGAYHATGNVSLLRGFITRSQSLVQCVSVVVAMLGALLVWVFRHRLDPSLAACYWIACGLLPLTASLQLNASTLLGLGRVRQSQIPGLVLRPALFGAGVVIVGLAGSRLTAPVAVAAQFGATLVALGVTAAALRRAMPLDVRKAAPSYETRLWLHTAAGLALTSVAQLVLTAQSDVLVVGTLLGTADAGIYGVASQLASLVGFAATAVVLISTPVISGLHAQQRRHDLQRLVKQLSIAGTVAALPIFVLLVLGGRWALGRFGLAFAEGYTVLLVLGAGQLIQASVGVVAGYLLTMTGHQRDAALIIGGSAGLSLGLALALTPVLGAVGAAASTFIATLARSVMLSLYIRNRLGISLIALPRRAAPAPSAVLGDPLVETEQ